ncbi:MAG: M1 family metallopeptidase [Gemmatimonadetes bacterium]|nr:M1 family metallopeptidase [Gemmatimonadota bacterium]
MNHYRYTFRGATSLAIVAIMGSTSAGAQSRPIPHPVVPPAGFRQAIEAGTRTARGEPGPSYWQQWTDYRLRARLLPESKRVEGSAQIVHHNHAPMPLPVLALHLHQNVHAEGAVRNRSVEVTGGVELSRVSSAGVDLREMSLQQSSGAGYEVDGTTLYVRLPSPVFPGDSVTLETDWSFTVPQAGMGRMGWSRDNLFFVAHWYPQIAVLDDVDGWQVDPYLGNAEFYAGYGSYELTVEAPAGWVVMGSGELMNRDEVLPTHVLQRLATAETSDRTVHVLTEADVRSNQATLPGTEGILTWRFQADTLRDVAFSATRASLWDAARTPVGDRDHDGTTDYVRVDAFYRASAPRWVQTTRYAQHAIDFLSRFTGIAYPWPHMSVVEGAGIIGGGMEFPMMTLIGDYNQSTDSALYYVTAHELAHMWVPMIVGIDERRRAWMDEGTTTFNENQARGEFYPGPNHHQADREQYVQFARTGLEGELMRWTDYHYSDAARGVASYSKPATILVALRALLGEDTFARGYQQYLADWAYKHPKPWDFFNTMATAAGRDLDWFWRTWYYETWHLDQAVSKVMETDSGTKIWVDDLGLAPMPVRLTITMVDGRQIREEIPVEEWLRGAWTVEVTVRTPSPVARVEIDAEGVFPDSDRRNNVWTAN